MKRFAAWLGLADATADDEDAVPPWHGVGTRTRRLWGMAWLAVAVVTFALLRWLMPLDDGLAGTAPVVIAVLLGALGLAWTERALVTTPRR